MSALLARAERALASAQTLLDIRDSSGAANRAYFACFQAMRAVLSDRLGIDVKQIKTHGGMHRVFNREVVRTGLLAPEIARIASVDQELRHEADYSLMEPDVSDARAAIDDAKVFVKACARLVPNRAGDAL